MSIIINKLLGARFAKSGMTKQWLLSNGFHFNRTFSNEEEEVYTYRFPVLKYEGFIVLECELRVTLGESRVLIDVYDYNTINRYAPFYYQEYGNYSKILKDIWGKIDKTIDKLGIKERISNESKYKENKRKRNNANKRKQNGGRI